MTEKTYFNFKQTSDYLATLGVKIGVSTLRDYDFKGGFIPPTIIAGKKIFEKSAIDAWVANRKRKPGSGRKKKGYVHEKL